MLNDADICLLQGVYVHAEKARLLIDLFLIKTRDTALKSELERERIQCEDICHRADNRLKTGQVSVNGLTFWDKAVWLWPVRWKMISAVNASDLAGILIGSLTEIVVDTIRALRTYPTALPETLGIVKRFVERGEHFLQELRSFL